MTGWEQAEIEYDIAREQSRAALRTRRADRFWPPIAGLLIIGGIALAGLIEGGAIS